MLKTKVNRNPIAYESDHSFKNELELSEIQSFYQGTTIFLTGGTGFIGALILEKLLRTCSEVKRIYILIREKKNKTVDERLKNLFNDVIFGLLKQEQPHFLEKISVIFGDCFLPNLGIKKQDLEILINEVNIVIHSAATVKFNEHLRLATIINVNAVNDLLKLSKEMKNLKSYVHISTAFSNCTSGRKHVGEVFYKPYISGDELRALINQLDDDRISEITPKLLMDWPNTYVMTKAIAENEVLINGKGLPIGIIRPSIIISTEKEPIPGWVNNINGPMSLTAASMIGLMRCVHLDPKNNADMIPGEYISNAVIAGAWDIHNQWKNHQQCDKLIENNASRGTKDTFIPPIYNIVSSTRNPISWGYFIKSIYNNEQYYTTIKAIWPFMLIIFKNKIAYVIAWLFLHTIPGSIIDFLTFITKKKSPKMMKTYGKLNKIANVLEYYCLKSWNFDDNNTTSLIDRLSKQDKSLFKFDIANLNWNNYLRKYIFGVRMYIIKDPIETLSKGLEHKKKLQKNLFILLAVLVLLLLLLLYGLYCLIF